MPHETNLLAGTRLCISLRLDYCENLFMLYFLVFY